MDNSEQKSLLDMPLEIADKVFVSAGCYARVKLRSTCGSIRDFCLTKDREISVLRLYWTTYLFKVERCYKNGTEIKKNVFFANGTVRCYENRKEVGTVRVFENGSHEVTQFLCDILSHPHLVIDKLEIDTEHFNLRRRDPEPLFSETVAAIAEMLRSLNRSVKLTELHVNSWRESTGVDLTLFLHALDETVLKKITHFKKESRNARFDTRAITESAQWKNAYDILFWTRPLDEIRDYWNVPVLSLRIDTISKETIEQLLEHYARSETFSKVSFFCDAPIQLTAASFPDLPRDETDQNLLFYYCAETNVTLTIRFMHRSIGIMRGLPTGI